MKIVEELIALVDNGTITEDDTRQQLNHRLRLPELRNKAITWNKTAVEKLIEKNLIATGWKDAYGKIFDLDFQRAAMSKRDEIMARGGNNIDQLVQLAREQYGVEVQRAPASHTSNGETSYFLPIPIDILVNVA